MNTSDDVRPPKPEPAAPSLYQQAADKVRTFPQVAGVYLMKDAAGRVIYVGKARSLKRRVSSYFHRTVTDPKTAVLMQLVTTIEVTVTNTETEALILEYNLIKEQKPRFNVLLRDDKSYPYIYVSTDHAFPRLRFHRGARRMV